MSTPVPKKFPFPGSGPGLDYRYDLVDYSPLRPTTAESWHRLHEACNYLEGNHKREYPKMLVNEAMYGGGAHLLTNFLRLHIGAYGTALECCLWVAATSLEYTFSITESAGGNSVTCICPYSGNNDVRFGKARLDLTTNGWTNISIVGDALAASHPTLVAFGCRIVQDRKL